MTMLPAAAQNLMISNDKQPLSLYGGCALGFNYTEPAAAGYYSTTTKAAFNCLGSSPLRFHAPNSYMDVPQQPQEEESTTNSCSSLNNEAAPSSSNSNKFNDYEATGWLQLGIGAPPPLSNPTTTTTTPPAGLTLELNLLPAGGGGYLHHSSYEQQQMMTTSNNNSRWADLQRAIQETHILKLINPPPRRPHSGLWFLLLPSPLQAREPFLPLLPKSYLRIKDERMTVQLLIKYLVNKFKLDSELKVEITCRGQLVQPCLTLQHVRDNIWSSREVVTLTSTIFDHIMVLHYATGPST